MTVLNKTKVYPNAQRFLKLITQLLSILWPGMLSLNLVNYLIEKDPSELTSNSGIIIAVLLLRTLAHNILATEQIVFISENILVKEINTPLLKRSYQSIHLNLYDFQGFHIEQDKNRFYTIIAHSKNNVKIEIDRDPNRSPLLRRFHERLEEAPEDWKKTRDPTRQNIKP